MGCTTIDVRTFRSTLYSGRGVEIPTRSGPAGVPTRFRLIRFVFKFLRTLLLFFALAQNSTLFFSSDSALFAKKSGCGGAAYLSHSACPDAVGALRGEGTHLSFKNYIENVIALASGVKKETGQTFPRPERNRGMSVPDCSVGLALRCEPVLGEQMHGHFAKVPNDAEPGEDLQHVVGDVDLPPEEALAR